LHPQAAERLVAASGGCDLPSFANMMKFKTCAEERPLRGQHHRAPAGDDVRRICDDAKVMFG